MPFDTLAAEQLACAAVQAFSEGLMRLVKDAEAEANADRLALAKDRAQLDAERARLAEQWSQLEAMRSRAAQCYDASSPETLAAAVSPAAAWPQFEPAKPAVPGSEDDQIVLEAAAAVPVQTKSPELEAEEQSPDELLLYMGEEDYINVPRSALMQHPDSMLASAIGGQGPPLPRDGQGAIAIGFPKQLFAPLAHYLRARETEDPDEPTQVPDLGDDTAERQFNTMLQRLGLFEWVYRRDLVKPGVQIGSFCYAVLPPRAPEEAFPWADMGGRVVTVPLGWEVLSADVEEKWAEVVAELATHGWGTNLLCAVTPYGEKAFTTKLYQAGDSQRFAQSAQPPVEVPGTGRRQYSFRGASSIRLIIRRPVQH